MPFLIAGMMWYPWPTVAVILGPCVLAFVWRPWRGGLLLPPLAVVGGVVGLPWWTTPLLAFVTAVMCLRFPARVRGGPEHVIVALLALLLVVSWVFPAGARAPDYDAFHNMAQVVAGLLVLAVSAAAPPSPRRLLTAIVISGTAVAVAALFVGDVQTGNRLQGFGLNPNYLGGLLVFPTVVSFAVAALRRAPLWATPGVITLSALIATQSRGALFAAMAGLAAVALLRGSRRARFLLVPAIVAMTVGVAAAPGTLNVSGVRSMTELERNNEVRGESAVLAVRLAAEYPLRGMGYGSFPGQAARSPELGIFINTHNDYLRLAAEAGIVSALLLALVICRGIRRAEGAHGHILAGVVVGYAVVLLFGNPLANLMVSTSAWVCLGALLGARHSGAAYEAPPGTSPRPRV
ncbi:O-antigen ligase family protein [Streptosporangium sp. NPDC004631]